MFVHKRPCLQVRGKPTMELRQINGSLLVASEITACQRQQTKYLLNRIGQANRETAAEEELRVGGIHGRPRG